MEEWNIPIRILSKNWLDRYEYLDIGDLVLVGPVHQKTIGILIERKEVDLSYNSDSWAVFTSGEVKIYPGHLIVNYYSEKLLKDNYCYNVYK